MKTIGCQLLMLAAGIAGAFPCAGASVYVDVNSTNPTPPYAKLDTAAVTIQEAVEAAAAGDTVYVASGVYSNGWGAEAPVAGDSNRVSIAKAIVVRSVDGPETTVIEGAGPAGPNAVRCVYLGKGGMLSGFTLRGGTTYSLGGGGAFMEGGQYSGGLSYRGLRCRPWLWRWGVRAQQWAG